MTTNKRTPHLLACLLTLINCHVVMGAECREVDIVDPKAKYPYLAILSQEKMLRDQFSGPPMIVERGENARRRGSTYCWTLGYSSAPRRWGLKDLPEETLIAITDEKVKPAKLTPPQKKQVSYYPRAKFKLQTETLLIPHSEFTFLICNTCPDGGGGTVGSGNSGAGGAR